MNFFRYKKKKRKMCVDKDAEANKHTSNQSFVDLVPVDDADIDSYMEALRFALESERINNIALTGPYGSGKSSIIRTFFKSHRYNTLNISLASFKEDGISDSFASAEQNILVERSILQQMLYGTDANKLTYSRFKRIAVPEHPLEKSILFVAWIVCCGVLYSLRGITLNEFILVPWWYFIALSILVGFALAMPAVLISDLYKLSFGCSFKKFSLKNMEVEAVDIPENSILNRHLDEIIYFFQVTSYDVVVIEDLDRFASPEIFVKLREINKLVNDSEKVSGHVKFLYALKDDMFAHKNRAKFFDFIIPVIPIVNTSNSLDKIQERLKGESYCDKIDLHFLQDISLYLDDLRMIHNVFNELSVYYGRLKSDSLNVTKLLAMMVYKNAYPDDFEKLHYGNGALVNVCHKKRTVLAEIKASTQRKIAEFRSSLADAEQEIARNEQDLVNSYIGHIVSHADGPCAGIRLQSGQVITLNQLKSIDQFKHLFDQDNLMLLIQNRNGQTIQQLNKSFKQLEAEVNPNKTFLQRKKSVANKTSERHQDIQSEIDVLNREMSSLATLPLNQLLQKQEVDIQSLVSGDASTNSDLLVYLIREGYLDEDYYIYTSNFYEGRWTRNDREYLLTIRNRSNVDPRQQIDTPAEVCRNMRSEDFSQKYALNITLIDYLIQNNQRSRIQAGINYISQNFSETDDFFAAYYSEGRQVAHFVATLSEKWLGFFGAAIESSLSMQHISSILRYADPLVIVEMNKQNVVSDFLSERGNLIFASEVSPPEDYDLLKQIDVKFMDLESLIGNTPLLDYAHKESLYVISAENVNYILKSYGNNDQGLNPLEQNYTAILAGGSECLKKYITENLQTYIDDIFLALPENTRERGDIVKGLIANDILDDDRKMQIITKEEYVFDSFDGISESLWMHLLAKEKVKISWINISAYLKLEDADNELLTELLRRKHLIEQLSNERISKQQQGEEVSRSLSRFVIENNDVNDDGYRKLIHNLPYWYHDFPNEVSSSKMFVLVKEKTVRLTEQSFSTAQHNEELLANLIFESLEEYLNNKDKYPIVDSVRQQILSMELGIKEQVILAQDLDINSVRESKELAEIIAEMLIHPEVDCGVFDDQIASLAVVNASRLEVSISILIKCIPRWTEAFTMSVLEQLPEPFVEIASYGKKRPKLEKTDENLQLAKLLNSRNFISSFKEEDYGIRVNTFESADH